MWSQVLKSLKCSQRHKSQRFQVLLPILILVRFGHSAWKKSPKSSMISFHHLKAFLIKRWQKMQSARHRKTKIPFSRCKSKSASFARNWSRRIKSQSKIHPLPESQPLMARHPERLSSTYERMLAMRHTKTERKLRTPSPQALMPQPFFWGVWMLLRLSVRLMIHGQYCYASLIQELYQGSSKVISRTAMCWPLLMEIFRLSVFTCVLKSSRARSPSQARSQKPKSQVTLQARMVEQA